MALQGPIYTLYMKCDVQFFCHFQKNFCTINFLMSEQGAFCFTRTAPNPVPRLQGSSSSLLLWRLLDVAPSMVDHSEPEATVSVAWLSPSPKLPQSDPALAPAPKNGGGNPSGRWPTQPATASNLWCRLITLTTMAGLVHAQQGCR